MSSRETTSSYYMNVIVNGLSGYFSGSREKGSNVNIKAQISKSRGNDFGTSVMAVLTHFGHQDPWVSAVLLRESLDIVKSLLVLISSLLVCILHGFLRIGTSNDRVLSYVSSSDLFNSITDLAHSCSQLGSLYRKSQQIAFTSFSGFSDCIKGFLNSNRVSRCLDLVETFNLLLQNIIIVDLTDFKVLFLLL